MSVIARAAIVSSRSTSSSDPAGVELGAESLRERQPATGALRLDLGGVTRDEPQRGDGN